MRPGRRWRILRVSGFRLFKRVALSRENLCTEARFQPTRFRMDLKTFSGLPQLSVAIACR